MISKSRILGISSSPRKAGTEYAVKRALEGAQTIEGVETQYLSLRGKDIRPCLHCDTCIRKGYCPIDDDAAEIVDLFFEFDGFIIGSPVYIQNYNAQLGALFNRMRIRSNDMDQEIRPLARKVVGAISVGGTRNCGQEMTVLNILNGMLSEGMIAIAGGKWQYSGACVYSKDERKWDSNHDEEGIRAAYDLGARVASLTAIIKNNATGIVLK